MGYTPSGIGGNSPQTVATPTTENFLGAVALNNFAVQRPDVDPNLTMRYGYQKDVTDMFERLGLRRRTSSSAIYRHWEEERLHAPVVLAATSGGSNGAKVTVNIATTDVFDIDSDAPYISTSSTEAIVPRVGDVGFFSNNVECVVVAVDPDGSPNATFDVIPTQSDEAVPTIQDGDEFAITSNVVGESSTRRTSKSGRVIYYQNNVQNVREDYKISGDAIGTETWINFDGPNGSGPYWYYYDMDRFFKRQREAFAQACLFGKNITNTTLANETGFETLKKTLGLVPTIKASGINEGYIAGSMTLLDLDNIFETLQEQMAPNEYSVHCSYGWRKDFNALIREGDGADWVQTDKASIIFANFNGGFQAVDFDIDSFKYNGYTLNIKSERSFSDPTQLGIIDDYTNFAMMLPMGEVNIYEELGGSYVSTPSMQIVYKGDGRGGDRALVEAIRGLKETGEDAFEHTLITEGGIETNAINHCVVMDTSIS